MHGDAQGAPLRTLRFFVARLGPVPLSELDGRQLRPLKANGLDVLKAGHHGSCNGISSHLLDLLTPSYVTMGVSSTNSYGHVHTQTKDLLAGRSIPWYRTDENGRVTFTTPGMPGGGYSVSYARGSASMDGNADVTSPQAESISL
jgi:competence protein ComEC